MCSPGALPALPGARLRRRPGRAASPASPSPWPTPPCCFVAEAEVRHVDLRDRDADEVLALLADHLALRDVLPQVLLDLAADDLAEAEVILFDVENHMVFAIGYRLRLLLRVASREDAGDEVQHVGRADRRSSRSS